jgi:alpha-beta hydrolase superfamily lysophospholipase
MISSSFTLNDLEGVEIFVRRFEPDSAAPKAVVQIAHGVGEHSGRYAWAAERFCAAGYACYADDHRGHGKTADATGGLGRLGPGGWDACVRDLALVSDRANADHPGLPLFLLGHSWGSHLAQDYIQSTLMSLEMSLAYKRLWREEGEAKIPKTLPILLMSGSEDATNAGLANLKPLAERYRNKYGIVDVTEKYYEGARHCVLHETNKEKVADDCMAWLDAHCAAASRTKNRRAIP